jgi:hypothetical protein
MLDKNNMCAILLLFLVVLISQAKFFNYLINTPLGRAILISIILFLSCIHKILGVVFVLIVIVIFSNSHSAYLEGMTTPTPTTPTTTTTNTTTNTNTTTTTMPTMSATADVTTTPSTKKKSEGFDMPGKERMIQRGHNSNSIPIHDSMRHSENVMPSESSSFSESFSLL